MPLQIETHSPDHWTTGEVLFAATSLQDSCFDGDKVIRSSSTIIDFDKD